MKKLDLEEKDIKRGGKDLGRRKRLLERGGGEREGEKGSI